MLRITLIKHCKKLINLLGIGIEIDSENGEEDKSKAIFFGVFTRSYKIPLCRMETCVLSDKRGRAFVL